MELTEAIHQARIERAESRQAMTDTRTQRLQRKAAARAKRAIAEEQSTYVQTGLQRAAKVTRTPGPQERDALKLCELIKAEQARSNRDGYLGTYIAGTTQDERNPSTCQ